MPEQDLAVALIVIGAVLMILGGLVPFMSLLCGLGVILLIVGVILVAAAPPRSAYYGPRYAYPGYAPPYAYPPQPPAAGMSVPGPQTQYTQPTCYVCGSVLTWVPQYGRWYCSRCQSYR
jgi:hypothetical protein